MNTMNISKIERQIIMSLLSSNTYTSSFEIAESTGIAQRLIRLEMKSVKTLLKKLGFQLTSKSSKGYRINPIFPNTLYDLVIKLEQLKRPDFSKIPTTPEERRDYIRYRLLHTNQFTKIDDLAEMLLVSRATISGDLKEIRRQFQSAIPNFTFINKPKYGIKFSGQEYLCRKLLVDIAYTKFKNSYLFYDLLHYSKDNKLAVESIIIQIINEYNINISDVALCDFFLCLATSVTRMRLGFFLTEELDISAIKDYPEFTIAKKIAHTLEQQLNYEIPELEVIQIGIELISKREADESLPYKVEAHALTDQILKFIQKEKNMHFKNYYSLYREIVIYNQGLLLRDHLHSKLRNPLYIEIIEASPEGYELAKLTSSIYEKNGYPELSLSDLSYFTTIFNAALRRNAMKFQKALLVCNFNGDTTKWIEWELLQKFRDIFQITNTIECYKLVNIPLEHYDFIIATTPIHEKLSIPCVSIEPLINEQTFNIIENFLTHVSYHNKTI